MHTLLLGALTSWPYNPSHFKKNIIFRPKIWNKLSSNNKTAAKTVISCFDTGNISGLTASSRIKLHPV